METMRQVITEGNHKSLKLNGFECVIKRNPLLLTLNGYVKIPDDISDEVIENLDCHGGITYDKRLGYNQEHWIGFDCAQIFDFKPGVDTVADMRFKVYKDMRYVENELKKLTKQLKEIKNGSK